MPAKPSGVAPANLMCLSTIEVGITKQDIKREVYFIVHFVSYSDASNLSNF